MSKAEELAKALDDAYEVDERPMDKDVAAELRRLAAENEALRSERTEWRVTAENAEEKKTQLQEFSKLAGRALDDCSRVLTTIDGESMHEQDKIDELNTRVTDLAVQAFVLNGIIHQGQLEETP